MAVAMLLDVPGGTRERYEEMSRKMFSGKTTPDEPPEGLILHTAGPTSSGWRLFDVWESREAFDRFMQEYVEPAMEGAPGPQPEVYELANVYEGKAAVRASS